MLLSLVTGRFERERAVDRSQMALCIYFDAVLSSALSIRRQSRTAPVMPPIDAGHGEESIRSVIEGGLIAVWPNWSQILNFRLPQGEVERESGFNQSEWRSGSFLTAPSQPALSTGRKPQQPRKCHPIVVQQAKESIRSVVEVDPWWLCRGGSIF